jgi:hypothetical protein
LHDINDYLASDDNDTTFNEYTSRWEDFVKNKLCFLEPKTENPDGCYNDWNSWLSLKSHMPNDFFVVDITLLFVAFISKYYVDNTEDLADNLQNQPRPRLGDENDFG